MTIYHSQSGNVSINPQEMEYCCKSRGAGASAKLGVVGEGKAILTQFRWLLDSLD